MRWKMLLLSFAPCLQAGGADAMRIDNLYGRLTVAEARSFVEYADEHASTALRNDGNAMIYGAAGGELEVLNLVYRASGWHPALPVMCRLADTMLAGRNDQPNGLHVEYVMGGVQPAWANADPFDYVGIEIGDIAGHILFVAENILATPAMWDKTVPDGDPYGYGETYRERALTYVRLCDQTLRDYIMKYMIRTDSDYRAFEDGPKTKATAQHSNCVNRYYPWNRQFMMAGGFMHGAACHRMLKDDLRLAAEYEKTVQAAVDFFVSQTRTQVKDGHVCALWDYWPAGTAVNSEGESFVQSGGKVEDANDAHMAYDLYGLYMCRLYGYRGVSDELVERFANTVKYVVYDPSNAPDVFHGSVDGTQGKADKNWLWPQCVTFGACGAELYRLIFEAPDSAMKRNLETNIERLGRALYVKSVLYGAEPVGVVLNGGELVVGARQISARRIRFNVQSVWSGGGGFQLSRLELCRGEEPLPLSGASITSNRSFRDGEGLENLLDGSVDTKAYSSAVAPWTITIDCGNTVTFDGYRWFTANDSVRYQRSPKEWTLETSSNGWRWTVVDSQSASVEPAENKALGFATTFASGEIDAIPDDYPLVIGENGVLRLWQSDETVGPLVGSGTIKLHGTSRLTVNGFSNSSFSGVFEGDGTLVIEGRGRVDITGADLGGLKEIVLKGGRLVGTASTAGDLVVTLDGGAYAASICADGVLTLRGDQPAGSFHVILR